MDKLTTEELIAEMEKDDLKDRLHHQTLASVIDYGKLRGIKPQLVYYHIRRGHIAPVVCECGRKCVTIAEADAFFGKVQDLSDGEDEAFSD